VGGKDQVAWPGGDPIGDNDSARWVAGTIAAADFGVQVRGMLTNSRVVFRETGKDSRAGGAALRYDFEAPVQASDWLLSGPDRNVPIPYHGSFWVEEDSGRLVELDVIADGIPATLGVTTVSKRLNYERARIDGVDLLLPGRSELATTDSSGNEIRNEARFHDCHPYVAAEVSASPPAALPEEFDIEVALETAIDSDTAAVGDPVSARVLQSIRRRRETVVPKGATLHARISNLELNQGYRFLDLAFTYFDVDGARIDIRSRSNEMDLMEKVTTSDLVVANPKQGPMAGRSVQTVSSRVPGPIKISGTRLRLARGFKLYLKSVETGHRGK